MAKFFNLARMTTATTGTGTLTLGIAQSGSLSFTNAGVSNGDVIAYGISDGVHSEVGTGVYTASGTTLTRSVTKSTNSNNPINLSGSATVFITARAEDITPRVGSTTDNQLVRWDGTAGEIQGSAIVVADTTGALSRTGGIAIEGTNTDDNAPAGYIGEYVSSAIVSGSSVALTNGNAANVTSISLTAGNWLVGGQLGFGTTGTTNWTTLAGGTSRTSMTLPPQGDDTRGVARLVKAAGTTSVADDNVVAIPLARMALTVTTTVYLVASADFSAGAVSAHGYINAIRTR